MKKNTVMKSVLQFVNIPRETVFTQVKAEDELSKDIEIVNAIKNTRNVTK